MDRLELGVADGHSDQSRHIGAVHEDHEILDQRRFLWAMMYFIPLPDLFYPRWARPLRERNRRVEAAWKQEFRRRRGQ